MNTYVISIEGVLAKDPMSIPFSATPVVREGIELLHSFGDVGITLVTGVTDRAAVQHWARSNRITHLIQHPGERWGELYEETWAIRLAVIEDINRRERGNIVVFDTSRLVRHAMLNAGVSVVTPNWTQRRILVDADQTMGLRRPFDPSNVEGE
jgi:hypothetical protein